MTACASWNRYNNTPKCYAVTVLLDNTGKNSEDGGGRDFFLKGKQRCLSIRCLEARHFTSNSRMTQATLRALLMSSTIVGSSWDTGAVGSTAGLWLCQQ